MPTDSQTSLHRTAYDLWKIWKDDILGGNVTLDALDNEIVVLLRKQPSQPVYEEMYQLFTRNSTPEKAKRMITHLLGSIATPGSAELLFKLIRNNTMTTIGLKEATIKSIRKFASRGKQWRDEPNYKIAHVMEQHWEHITDKRIYGETAIAMAKIGRESSIRRIMKKLTEPSLKKETEHVLMLAISNIRNAKMIPELYKNLGHTDSEKLLEGSLLALVQIGTFESTNALVDWAINASAKDSEKLQKAYTSAIRRSPIAVTTLAKRLPHQKFKAAENKKILENILKANKDIQ